MRTQTTIEKQLFQKAHLQAEKGRRRVDEGARLGLDGGAVDGDPRQRLLAASCRGGAGGNKGDQRIHRHRGRRSG
jgi:hypothetical protein